MYGPDYYKQCGDVVNNPIGVDCGDRIVIRGGAYNSTDSRCEVLNRTAIKPSYIWNKGESDNCGIRLVLGKPIIRSRDTKHTHK